MRHFGGAAYPPPRESCVRGADRATWISLVAGGLLAAPFGYRYTGRVGSVSKIAGAEDAMMLFFDGKLGRVGAGGYLTQDAGIR